MIALRLCHQFVCLAALSLLFAGCAGKPPPPPSKPAAAYKIGKPYQIAGVWYYPREQPDYDETGIASWYGPGFHGKPTALGEIYDMNALTAAHKTLPLPVTVRVTNLENGRSILLKVNDRGPFVAGRIIDVSRRGAQLLGFGATGTAPVRVQIQDGGVKPGTFIEPGRRPALKKRRWSPLFPLLASAVRFCPEVWQARKLNPYPRQAANPRRLILQAGPVRKPSYRRSRR